LSSARRISVYTFSAYSAVRVGLFIFFLFVPVLSHALDVPKLEGYVNDYAGMISPQAKTELEGELAGFERTDSTQIVILTVPSLEGDTIEDFGIRVADVWRTRTTVSSSSCRRQTGRHESRWDGDSKASSPTSWQEGSWTLW
jgi:hypothetical protein